MRRLLALGLFAATLCAGVQAQTGLLSGSLRSISPSAITEQQTPKADNVSEQIATLKRNLEKAERDVSLQTAKVQVLSQQESNLALLAQNILDVQELSVQRYRHAIDGLQSLQRLMEDVAGKRQDLLNWQPPGNGPPWPLQLADETYLSMTESQVLAEQYRLHGQLLQMSRQGLLDTKQALEAKLRQLRPAPGLSTEVQEQQALRSQLQQVELQAVDLELLFADTFVKTNELDQALADLTHQISRKDWLYMDNRFYLDQAAFNRIEEQINQNIERLIAEQNAISLDNDQAINAFNQATKRLLEAQVAVDQDPETLLKAERAVTLASDRAKLQRMRRDISFYRYEALKIAKQLWQIRFDLYQNRHNSEALGNLNTVFGDVGAQVKGWQRYDTALGTEMRRERQAFLDGAALSPTKAEGDFLRERADIMQQRIDVLTQSMSGLTSTEFLLNITMLEIDAFEQQASFWQRLLNARTDIAEFASNIWQYEIFTVSDTVTVEGRPITTLRSVTIGKSVGALLILVVGLLLIKRIVSGAMRVALRRNRIGASASMIITRWVSLFAGLTLIIFSLVLMDIPLGVFAFAGGALAIGIGFGAQHLLQNLISGLILLLEKPVRVGDWVEIGGVTGSVTSIGLRFSTLMSPTGTEHIIPNSVLVQEKLINWTYSSPEVRREVEVWVDYRTDSETVTNILMAVASDHPVVLEEPRPRVLLHGFTERGMLFKLQFWAPMSGPVSGPVVMSEVRREIHARFMKYGIQFAHPLRTVTIESASAP
jgi:small-conductance mechanosensitive channel